MNAAINLLGFKRLTAAIRARIEILIDEMFDAGLIQEHNERLQLRDKARTGEPG